MALMDRSIRADVRNPLVLLPGAEQIRALPPEAKAALLTLLDSIRADARRRADQCWKKHKAPMAAYWKAVAVYAGHLRKLCRPSTPDKPAPATEGLAAEAMRRIKCAEATLRAATKSYQESTVRADLEFARGALERLSASPAPAQTEPNLARLHAISRMGFDADVGRNITKEIHAALPALLSALENYRRALEEIFAVGAGYGANTIDKPAGTNGEGHSQCREIAYATLWPTAPGNGG